MPLLFMLILLPIRGRYFNYYQWIGQRIRVKLINIIIFLKKISQAFLCAKLFPYNYVDGKQITKVDILYDYEYLFKKKRLRKVSIAKK